jgi:hypothetical protein
MAITNKNLPLLHRKEFQMMTPAPAATVAGAFVVAPDSGNFNNALYVRSATEHYLYNHDEDAFMQIPSGALAGTFGAGACGVYHPWSINYTANGGSTTSVTVAAGTHNITGRAVGQTIEFISAGTASGFRTTITSILNNAGAGTITLNLAAPAPTSILNTHTFRLTTGRFYVMNAGTIAAGIFKVFDVATVAWQANLVTTNLPASWGTDGKLVLPYNFSEIFATGTATAGAGSTLTNSGKSWTTNQWTNYMVRITGGTGIGQTRVIASNTGTVLTVSSAWTTNPDATSTYEITANEDWLYLLGNNAVTMYRYSISANTWTVLAPTVARSGAPVAGMTANAVGITGDALWASESAILNGRYIYSFRGGVATLDRFDIAGGTAGAGAWAGVTYVGTETFGAGSSAFPMGEFIYIKKDATNRFFKYSVVDNAMRPFATNTYTDGVALLGHKVWVKNLPDSDIKYLYSLMNTGTALHRIMIF